MKATIIAIGKCRKNSPEKQLIDEYIKRSGWEVTIKEHDNASGRGGQVSAFFHPGRGKSGGSG